MYTKKHGRGKNLDALCFEACADTVSKICVSILNLIICHLVAGEREVVYKVDVTTIDSLLKRYRETYKKSN